MKVYIGWDRKNALAYEVAARSLIKHSSVDLEIIPLHEWDLRHKKIYHRSYIVDELGQYVDRGDRSRFSTEFAFTRFCIPKLEEYKDEWVLFTDSDILWRSDISDLISFSDEAHGVLCVKHEHIPYEASKMYGLKQSYYKRKNWSSVMLMNPAKCTGLTTYAINNWSGESLHSMMWIDDNLIGELPPTWNYLVGSTDPKKIPNPNIVHFTLGTPDMPDCGHFEYSDEWKEYADKVEILGSTRYVYTRK